MTPGEQEREPAFTENGLCVNCGERQQTPDPKEIPVGAVRAMIDYAERATYLGFMVSFNDLLRAVFDSGEVVPKPDDVTDNYMVAVSRLKAERDRWIRLFNRLDAAISHHRKGKGTGFADDTDDALAAAHDRVLKSASQGDSEAVGEFPPRWVVGSLQAQLDEAREAFATVAMKLLLNGEPTAGELREQLVKAGIDGPDRLSELASPPSEGTE